MPQIGSYEGYTIYWTDPATDGGRGSDEVMVGKDSVRFATTRDEALRLAQRHIATYLGKMGR
jgi:hypothetical protein